MKKTPHHSARTDLEYPNRAFRVYRCSQPRHRLLRPFVCSLRSWSALTGLGLDTTIIPPAVSHLRIQLTPEVTSEGMARLAELRHLTHLTLVYNQGLFASGALDTSKDMLRSILQGTTGQKHPYQGILFRLYFDALCTKGQNYPIHAHSGKEEHESITRIESKRCPRTGNVLNEFMQNVGYISKRNIELQTSTPSHQGCTTIKNCRLETSRVPGTPDQVNKLLTGFDWTGSPH